LRRPDPPDASGRPGELTKRDPSTIGPRFTSSRTPFILTRFLYANRYPLRLKTLHGECATICFPKINHEKVKIGSID